jgi:WD40 repeat protein
MTSPPLAVGTPGSLTSRALRARSRGGFPLLVLLAAALSSGSSLTRADENTTHQAKPIPIAKIKRSTAVSFDEEILPILKDNCLACHNKTTAKARLILETPQDILKGGESGPAAEPKQSGASLLLKAASHQLEDTIMPPPANKVQASELTPGQLGLIKLWIDQGAKASASVARPIEWQPLPEGLNPIYAVALAPDGQFAACARANQIFIYHLPSKQLVGQLTDPQLLKSGLYHNPGVAHRSMVNSLAFSPDGALLASGAHREVKIWRRPKDAQQLTLPSAARKRVLAVTASPDGKWLVTGADDGRVKIWNLATGKSARSLTGHKGAITSLKISADGTRLASASADKTLRIWDLTAGKVVAQARTDSKINAVTWVDSRTRLATGDADGLIRIWRLESGKPGLAPVKELAGHQGPVTALDTVPPDNAQILSGSDDGSARVWNVETGQTIREIRHGGPIAAVAVRRDGKRFASAGMDKVARLWDTNDGKEIAQCKGDRYALERVAERERALEFTKAEVIFQKAALNSAETNQTAQVERLNKATSADESAEKALAEIQKKVKAAVEAKVAVEKALEEAKTAGRKATDDFAAADRAAKEAEAGTATEHPDHARETIEKGPAEAAVKSKSAAEKASVEAKQKEKEVAEKLKSAAKALEETEKELKKAEQAKSNADTELQLAGKAAAEAAATVNLARETIQKAEELQAEAGTELDASKEAATGCEQPLRAIAFSPDNLTLATAGDDGTLRLWSAENGAAFETLKSRNGPVLALAFAPDGLLISGSADRAVVVWDLRAGWKLDQVLGAGDADSPLADRVNAVRFSPNGEWLATGGGEPTRDGEITLWEVAGGKLAHSYTNVHSDAVFSLDFSPDGKYLASGAADKFVKVIEIATGKIIKQFEGHTHHVLGVSWNRNQRTLASAGADDLVKIWDFVKGEKKKNIAGFDKEVTAISFVGYTDQALAVSGDAKVRLVREDGAEVRSFSGANDFVESAAITPDGKIVIAGGQDSVLRVWNGTDGTLIASFPSPNLKP